MVNKQVAQQMDGAAGLVSYGQKRKTVTGRQYFTDIIGPILEFQMKPF